MKFISHSLYCEAARLTLATTIRAARYLEPRDLHRSLTSKHLIGPGLTCEFANHLTFSARFNVTSLLKIKDVPKQHNLNITALLFFLCLRTTHSSSDSKQITPPYCSSPRQPHVATDEYKMPMTWNAEADAKVCIAIFCTFSELKTGGSAHGSDHQSLRRQDRRRTYG